MLKINKTFQWGVTEALTAVILFFAILPFEALASRNYPVVGAVQGNAFLLTEDNKKIALKKSTPVKANAHLETTLVSSAQIFLDSQRVLTLLGGTEVAITASKALGHKATVISLKKGQLRWQDFSDGKKPDEQSILRSEVFESVLPPGDFLLTLNTEKGTANIKAFQGEIQFSVLNEEDSKTVTEGSEATFEGVVESGEFVFDELLKGKKIPRGHLLPVELISQDDVRNHQKLVKKEGSQIVKLSLPEKKAKKVLSDKNKIGLICDSPSGKYNDCVWTCIGNPKDESKKCQTSLDGVSCVRQRCDGSGRWIESMKVDSRKSKVECSVKPIVAPCDY